MNRGRRLQRKPGPAAADDAPPSFGDNAFGCCPNTGRGLVVPKTSVVDAVFDKLDLNLRNLRSTGRMVSMTAYEAGGAAGASLAINPGLGEAQS
jgi:hypothetical protein